MMAWRRPNPKKMSLYGLGPVGGTAAEARLDRDIDWAAAFAEAVTQVIDGVRFVPSVEEDFGVLKMYKPIDASLKSAMDANGQARDASDREATQLQQFSDTSAAIFVAGGRVVAIIRGGQSAPTISHLRRYLDREYPFDGGRPWDTRPFQVAPQLQRLRQEGTGARSFSTRVVTAHGLFDEDEHNTALDQSAEALHRLTGANMQVDLNVSFDADATGGQKRRLLDVVTEVGGHPRGGRFSRTKVRAEFGDEIEDMILEWHALHTDVEVPCAQGASPRFTDLLASAVRAAGDTEGQIRRELD